MARIFYSWQSDLPNATNRGFIGTALERAAKAIRDDGSIEVQPVVDRDTAGVGGSPDISATIFSKIDAAAVFVGDVSIIGSTGTRPTPNPNVLIELGYAKKALGPERVVMVMNTAFGAPEELPFDLRPRRVVTYHMPATDEDRAPERRRLEARLEAELRTVLTTSAIDSRPAGPPPLADQLIEAIREGRPHQASLARRFMRQLALDLDVQKPDLDTSLVKEAYERLAAALPRTIPLAIDFAQVGDAVATYDAGDAARAIFQGFSGILEGYDLPPGYSGGFYGHQFDFLRFVGHELIVTLFAMLIREERWETISDLLEHDIPVRNAPHGQGGVVSFEYASRAGGIWRDASRVMERVSLQSDLIDKRHTEGPLAELVPAEQFMDADYFLFLRSVLTPSDTSYAGWAAWSCLRLRHVPRYLLNAVRVRGAEQLLRPLGVADIATMRSRLRERGGLLSKIFETPWYRGIPDFDPNAIGSRP